MTESLCMVRAWPLDTTFGPVIVEIAELDLRIRSLRACRGDKYVGLDVNKVAELDKEWGEICARPVEYGIISSFHSKGTIKRQ